MGKTLCDTVAYFLEMLRIDLLREGFRRGLVSRQQPDGGPQNIWAITAVGEPPRAQLEGNGVYHPLPENDPFRDVVLQRARLG
jgi:hypothetical protein